MSLLPDYFIIRNLSETSVGNSVTSESQSLIQLTRRRNAQRFDFSVECIVLPQNTKKAAAWQMSLLDGSVPNEFVLPVFGQSSASDTVTTSAAVTGETSVDLNNATDVEEGDLFTFAGHTKAYRVISISVNTISFLPNLRGNVALSEAVTFNPEFTVRKTNVNEFTSDSARRPQNFNLEFAEVL